ncbi:MAG TPA: FAD-dependent oxidoreductase [Polyangiaceae bacterium]|nr:FAD-dependent oxidoreductase [Polyangiaceae bacterium]
MALEVTAPHRPQLTHAVVQDVLELNPRIRVIELSIRDRAFVWSAGQHLDLILEDETGAARRPYSIACAHDQGSPGRVELAIASRPGGRTWSFISRLSRGDVLAVEGPFGGFRRSPDPTRPLILIAGGTGYAPLRALLQAEMLRDPSREATLLLGGAVLEEVPWSWELAQEPFARVRAILTLVEPPSGWRGAKGRVTAHLPALAAARPHADFFVSGPQAMIEAVRAALSLAGVHAHRIVEPVAESVEAPRPAE